MENFIRRFPDASEMIFNNLDDQSLTRSKEVSRNLAKHLENERFYWIRIIKSANQSFKGFEELWKEVIDKAPVDIVKELRFALQQFLKAYPGTKVAPLHIAAEKGTFHLCQYVMKKSKEKNPQINLTLSI